MLVSSTSDKRYLPDEVPDHLFTQSRLNRMGLVPTAEHVAYVVYPEQRQQFKLYDISATRKRKQQKEFSLMFRKMRQLRKYFLSGNMSWRSGKFS